MDELRNIVDFSGLRLSLASPEEILAWSHGEVLKPETINYRTLRTEKDGLFDERIFGPTKDWECYCGKYKRVRYRGVICDKCGVEVTHSRVRRERMGHISLAASCAHVWFFKGSQGAKLSLILDISPRALESVVYFAQYLVTEVDEKKRKEAAESLEKSLKETMEKISHEANKKEEEVRKEIENKIEETRVKIKSKEQLVLALKELELRQKQEVQQLREEKALEEGRAKELYQALSERVRNLSHCALLNEDELLKLSEYNLSSFFKAETGAEALVKVIQKIDFEKLAAELREEAKKTSGQRHVKATKRLRIIEGLRKAGIDPSWMILKVLPVIPPDLRPMVQLSGGRFATSDLNDLYRRVINRNNRLKHLIDLGAPEIILRNEKRMLQESVDALIDSSHGRIRERRRAGRPLRSLSDMLRGKQGRFRQNLLGKRVDYSGRSVIVVGPELRLDQCGLPKEMALEMFKPYVLREMIIKGLAPNVRSAKNMLEHRPPEVFDILEEITRNHPVMLNRAPTLHKLGIQGFYPILIEGSAIRIHPSVCRGFNADFDGDQMAVHIPLSQKAQEEVHQKMLPKWNLLKPADGSPIVYPDREIALGTYYLTSVEPESKTREQAFTSKEEIVLAYQSGRVRLRQPIKVKFDEQMMETTVGRIFFNEILPQSLRFINDAISAKTLNNLVAKALKICDLEEVIQLIDDLKNIGFEYATFSGVSVSLFDCEIIEEKDKIIKEANKKVAGIENNFNQGLITLDEEKRLAREVWMETTEKLADLTWEALEPDSTIKIIVSSGSTKANKNQIKQISAMRGLVVDPLGRIVDLPTKSNFREGLSVFEYVTSARGSRKGLTDTAIKTSDAGYLTRRLVDVSHDALVKEEDCGTSDGIEINRLGVRSESFFNRIVGRVLAEDITVGKKVILKKGELINEDNVGLIEDYKIERVIVRSPLTCKTKRGFCSACYGVDLGSKKMVELGMPVGVVAAQSIGEPGTQLTLRTKHTAGVVGLDVTQGLPRVEELLEVRTPKILSPLAEISGQVSIVETDEGYKVRIKSVGIKPVEEREYLIPLTSTLWVKDKQKVKSGAQLASGSLDVREVLEVKGLKAAQEYLVNEAQAVYESQGLPIHDKHFEMIIRKMSEKVMIIGPGDTDFLVGELLSRHLFEDENAKVLAEGGEPATAQVIILGITRAAITTDSWLSAASFQNTTSVLTEACLVGKEDPLSGLKENVIIGRLIPVTPQRAKEA